MYFGLQTGWISMMSLQSSLLGFAIFKPLNRYLRVPFGPIENVLLQTTAVATATMPLAGGFVGIIPALTKLTLEESPSGPIRPTFGQLLFWGFGIAFFGVFFAIPLRKQTIIKEKLRFPSGTATAQMISLLHQQPDPTEEEEKNKGHKLPASGKEIDVADDYSTVVSSNQLSTPEDYERDWKSKMVALYWSFGISGVYTLVSHFVPVINALPLGDWITGFHVPFAKWNWYLTPSFSYAGQGIIMGLHTTISMLAGAIVGWGILGPAAHAKGWAPGNVNDTVDSPRSWILWISLAIMISESLVSLSVVTIKEVAKRWQDRQEARQRQDGATEAQRQREQHQLLLDEDENLPAYMKVPDWVTYGGLVVSSALCVVAASAVFDITWYASLLSVVLACFFSIIAVRALGETDLNPVSGIGKLSQVIFAGVAPGNIIANLIAGGIAEAGAQQAGDMMQDLKTGHLLHASPRAQFYGQLAGSFFSVIVAVLSYWVFSTVYTIPGPEFTVPTADIWLKMSRLVNGQPLPPNSVPFIIGSAILFAIPPLLELVRPNARFLRYLPSGIAFAMGIYTTPNYVIPRFIGALGAEIYKRYRTNKDPSVARSLRVLIIVVASGFVLGEGIIALVNLILSACHIKAATCAGCIPGTCPGC
ncbi:OPT oligopeptide transporter protein-domain-containing protein [Syncephalis fuscata]|nr:OPT oligopeptide transporter protein-domain-containing protein [Syncephalis fuscata]